MSQDNTGSDSMDQLSSDTVNKLLSNLTNDKTILKEVKLQSSTSESDTMPIKELLPPKKSVKFDENANVTKQKSALKKTAIIRQPVEIKDNKVTNEVKDVKEVEQKNTSSSTVKVATAGLISLMGFNIPLQTLYLLIVCVLIAIGIYYVSNKQTTKKKTKKTDDESE